MRWNHFSYGSHIAFIILFLFFKSTNAIIFFIDKIRNFIIKKKKTKQDPLYTGCVPENL